MSAESQLRAWMFIFIVATPAIRLFFSQKADRSRDNPDALQWAVILATLAWPITVTLFVFSDRPVDLRFAIPASLRWLGVWGMALSTLLSVWVYATLGKQFHLDLRIAQKHELIRHGPYKFVRHPMYSALFLCVVSSVLVSASMFVLAAGLFLILVFLVRARAEERILRHYFRSEYLDYKKKTGFLFPRVWS